MRSRSVELLLLLMLFPGLPCIAATIHVPADHPTIQAGVDVAVDGDTVLVADGTYTGAGNVNVLIAGKAITLQSVSGPESTIIDCQAQERGFTIGPVSSGVVTIDGFTIINGEPAAGDPFQGGGAAVFRLVEVIVRNCTMQLNRASEGADEDHGIGGAFYIDVDSQVQVTGCEFSENEGNGWSGSSGGAIYCDRSDLTIHDSCFFENYIEGRSNDSAGALGGAIHADDSSVLITGSEFRGNRGYAYATNPYSSSAVAVGGAISATDSTISVEESRIIDNSVYAEAYACSISRGGGVRCHGDGSLALRDCLLSGNHLGYGYGGAIYSTADSTLITNCLFLENQAVQVIVPYDHLEMEGCSVVSGSPDDSGATTIGGVYCYRGSIRNSIIWGNPEAQLYVSDEATVEYCAIEDGWPGTGNIDSDPLFAPGPLGSHYLSQVAAGQQQDSPSVDAGNPSTPPAGDTTRTDSVLDADVIDMGYHHAAAAGLYICHYPPDFSFLSLTGGPPPDDATIDIRPCMGGTLEWSVESSATWLSLEPLSGVSDGEPDPVMISMEIDDLPTGLHRATITIQADGARNSPLQIPVELRLSDITVSRSPYNMVFEEIINGAPAEEQLLEIWTESPFPLDWTVSCLAPWLTLDPASGQSTGEHDEVTVQVDSSGLASGTYHGRIVITDPDAVNSPVHVPVTFKIYEAMIDYYPSVIIFSCESPGPPPPDQFLQIWNGGDTTMSFELTDDADWLSLDPTSGSSGGIHCHINVMADHDGLETGRHDATIMVTSHEATNSPQPIPVILFIDDSEVSPAIAVSPGPGPLNPSMIRVFPPDQDATPISEFTAYAAPGYGAGLSCGDFDADGSEEIVTGPGPGETFGPHVRGFEPDGTPLPGFSFLAYGTNTFGVIVAAGDIDGDGFDEIVTGAGPSTVFGPHVRAFDYDGAPGVTPVPGVSFFAYGTPKWGVNVATGDIDGDGFDEIITGPGPGTMYGPHVRGWNVDGGPAAAIPTVNFLAYGTNQYGVHVSCGDVDDDGIDEIVTGSGPCAVFGPHVRGWNYDGSAVSPLPGYSFLAWHTPPFGYGVSVYAGADLVGHGRDELLAGRGPHNDADTEVKIFFYNGASISQWISLEAYPGFSMGTNVAAGRF